jgi:hypothetical protein
MGGENFRQRSTRPLLDSAAGCPLVGKASRNKRERRAAKQVQAELKAALTEFGSTLDERVADLKELLFTLPFLQVIGNMHAACFVGAKSKKYPFVMPLAMEYITWLYLTTKEAFELDGPPINGPVYADFERRLNAVLDASRIALVTQAGEAADQDRAGFALRAQLHASNLRNLGLLPLVRDQLRALFGPFTADLERLGLVGIDELIKILDGLMQVIPGRLEADLSEIRGLRAQWLGALDDEKAFAALEPEVQALLSKYRSGSAEPAKDVEIALVFWSIARVPSSYIFDRASLADAVDVDEVVAQRFLETFSLGFGQRPVMGGRPGVFPAQQRAPNVRLPDGFYLLHLVGYLWWSVRGRYDDALGADAALGQRYSDHRASFLENHAVDLIAATSAHSQPIRRCWYWFDDSQGLRRYEADGLVFVDSALFVIEAKAGRLRDASRRGTEGAVKELRGLVADAQRQAARVERYIRSGPAEFELEDGSKVVVEATSHARVILLNVTLEPLHAFVTRWSDLAATGIVQKEPWIWSINIVDLRAITEIAESAGQLVHFLKRRQELDRLQFIAAEELDLFGNYLDQGLYFEDLREGRLDMAMIDSWSDDIEAHYERGGPAPRMTLPPTVRDLLLTLAEVAPSGWIDATILVLEGSSEAHQQLAEFVEDRMSRVKSGGAPWAMSRMVFGDTILAFMASEKAEREKLGVYVTAVKYEHRANLAVGIGLSVKDPNSIVVYVDADPWVEDPELAAASAGFVQSMFSRDMKVTGRRRVRKPTCRGGRGGPPHGSRSRPPT